MLNTNLILLISSINIIFFVFFNKLNSLINIYDKPNWRKIHQKSVACTGGIYLIINLSILTLFYKNNFFDAKNLFLNLGNFYSIYVSTLLIFIVGLIDDLVDLSALKKTIFLIILIYLAVLSDSELIISNLHFSFTDHVLYLRNASVFFTLLCIFIFMVAFNMFDGTNLQSSFYSLVIITFLILNSGYINIFAPLIAFFIFFIFYNSQGKIFLGNSGSHILGFVFSWFIIKFYNKGQIPDVDNIILLMLVPGLDLIRLFFWRTIKKKSFFNADQNHIHHVLMKKAQGIKLQLLILFLVLFPIIVFYLTKLFFLSLILGITTYFLLFFACNKSKK